MYKYGDDDKLAKAFSHIEVIAKTVAAQQAEIARLRSRLGQPSPSYQPPLMKAVTTSYYERKAAGEAFFNRFGIAKHGGP